MFFNPFIVSAIIIGINSYQELMFGKMLDGYTPTKKEEVPKGYYICVDCGEICKRLNASQKRCAECQKIHAKELKRKSDKKRRK